jgi:hypothetical protein
MSSWREQGHFTSTFAILPRMKVTFEKRTGLQLVKKFPTFTEPAGSLLCFQEPIIGPFCSVHGHTLII